MTRAGKPAAGGTDGPAEPHSLETERAALGAALLSSAAADYVADHLTVDSFYRKAHRTLFEAVQALRQAGQEVDLVTLRDRLGKALDAVGGAAYITALTDGRPRTTHVGDYCANLNDLRLKRALLRYARDVGEAVQGGDGSGALLVTQADRKLMELQAGYTNGRMSSLKDGLVLLMEDLDYRAQHRGELLGLDTGFRSVNDLTLGWQAGDMNIIAARPSIGKSTFAINTAVAAARSGKRVALFSLEMRRRQIEHRILSSLSGVALQQIMSGWVSDAVAEPLSQAYNQMGDLAIEIDDTTGRTVWDIRGACRRLKADGGLDLVIVDYVQLMPGTLDKRGATRNEEITDISRRLKTLADEASLPVLVLSQLNRGGTDRPDPRPKLIDLRESGALEQDADRVCFLHRKHHKEGGSTEFIVEKARNGPTGTVILSLNLDTTTFTDGGEPLPAPTPEEQKQAQKVKQVSFFRQRARRS